jgi:cystathionine beta-lyase
MATNCGSSADARSAIRSYQHASLASQAMTSRQEHQELNLERLRERRSAKWTEYDADVLPAWVAEMDLPLAEPIRAALIQAIEIGDTGYANAKAAGLAEAFAGFAGRRLGWSVDPAQVVSVPDVVHGLSAMVSLLTEPGDEVVVTPPVYHPFFILVNEIGRRVREVPMTGGRELDVERIEAAFADGARVLLLCSPHNPAGTIPSRSQLEAVADAAARHGAWVLADEIHAPLTLPGATHTPFLEVSDAARERGFGLTSASKAFNTAGLVCSVIVSGSDTAQSELERLPKLARHPGHLGVLGSVAAFADPGSEAWLEETIALLDGNRSLLGELLAEQLPQAGYQPQAASYLAWIDLSDYGLGDDPAPALLERGRIAVSSGPMFGSGGEGFVRLNVGTSPELVREAVARIAKGVGA